MPLNRVQKAKNAAAKKRKEAKAGLGEEKAKLPVRVQAPAQDLKPNLDAAMLMLGQVSQQLERVQQRLDELEKPWLTKVSESVQKTIKDIKQHWNDFVTKMTAEGTVYHKVKTSLAEKTKELDKILTEFATSAKQSAKDFFIGDKEAGKESGLKILLGKISNFFSEVGKTLMAACAGASAYVKTGVSNAFDSCKNAVVTTAHKGYYNIQLLMNKPSLVESLSASLHDVRPQTDPVILEAVEKHQAKKAITDNAHARLAEIAGAEPVKRTSAYEAARAAYHEVKPPKAGDEVPDELNVDGPHPA